MTPHAATAGLAPPRLSSLLHLAWPVIISRSSQVVVGVCDAIMVARLGEAALAATTTGALNTFTLLILPLGVCFLVQSFAAQMYGKKDLEGARRYGFYGLAIALGSQAVSVGGIFFVPGALSLFGYADDVRGLMTDYLQVRLLAGGAAIGLEALAAYFGGLGNTRLPMLANIAAMVLNVFLNWVLIFGHLGAPALGVTGAAAASALATTIAFAGLLACFLLGIGGGARRTSGLSLAELGRLLRFGLPAGLNWFFEFLAFSFFVNVVVVGLGTTALAAMMAVLQLNSVAFMPSFGLASAGAILVGQSIGAGRPDEVPSTVRLTFAISGAWMGLVALSYLLFPELLLAPFLDRDGATGFLEVGVRMLMLSAAWQIVDAAVMTLSEALRAAGDTAFPMWARTVIAWLFFAPGSYYTVRVLEGGDVVAVGWMAGYLAVLALVLFLRFRSGAWRRINLVGDSP